MNPQPELPLVIFGVPFHRVTLEETVRRCLKILDGGTPGFVATPNLDFVMRAGTDPELYRILARADLVIADGMPIVWLAKFLGPALPERVAGSDLVVHLAEAAASADKSIFPLGGAEGVPEAAGRVLQDRFPGLRIAGSFSPPKADLLDVDNEEILSRLEKTEPDILYVAFGAPKQEKWINQHLNHWNVGLALGIGGSLDFLAGAQRRAPVWMQKTGIEWIWRLGTDPKRLWKRYGANLVYLLKAVMQAAAIRCRSARPTQGPEIPAEWQEVRVAWTPLDRDEEAHTRLETWGGHTPAGPLWVDASDCQWLDSRELGFFLLLGRRYRETGNRLMVTGLSPRVEQWLLFNGLDQLITIVKTAEDIPPAGPEQVEEAVLKEGVLILTPPAELTAASTGGWKEIIEHIWDPSADINEIRLHADRMTFMDSTGLGALIGLKRKALARELPFHVEGLHGAALTTVKMARAEQLLGVDQNETDKRMRR